MHVVDKWDMLDEEAKNAFPKPPTKISCKWLGYALLYWIFALPYKRFVALLVFLATIFTVFCVPSKQLPDTLVKLAEIAATCVKSAYISVAVIAVLLCTIIWLLVIIEKQRIKKIASDIEKTISKENNES